MKAGFTRQLGHFEMCFAIDMVQTGGVHREEAGSPPPPNHQNLVGKNILIDDYTGTPSCSSINFLC